MTTVIDERQIKDRVLTGASFDPQLHLYDETKSYTAGNVVHWQGKLYVATGNVGAKSEGDLSNAPTNATNLWEEVSLNFNHFASDPTHPIANTLYYINDELKFYDGSTYYTLHKIPPQQQAQLTIKADEDLQAWDIVTIRYNISLYSDQNIAKLHKARGEISEPDLYGFVKQDYSAGDNAVVYFSGIYNSPNQLTPAVAYYLDLNNAGKITKTVPTEPNRKLVKVGFAISETQLVFNIETLVIR